MDTDTFWQLIAGSLEQASGRSARERYLTARLTAFAPAGILAFQALLDRAVDQAFTWDLAGAATRIFGGWCSDDGFEYFRLWLVGRGRATFEQAVAAPDSLAGVPAITRLAGRHRREWDSDQEWPEWETLGYVAGDAYALVTGDDDECREAFHAAMESRFGGAAHRRDPSGQPWDAREEQAAAARVPQLAARFPLI